METDDALHAADACISHFSLSSFTAAYLGIPTILTLLPEDAIRIRGVLGLYPTTLLGGTVEVYDCASFVHAFTDLRKPSEDFLANIRRSIVTSTDAIIARLIKRISTTPHHGAIPTKGTIHGRQN
jgi:hypothetical protein